MHSSSIANTSESSTRARSRRYDIDWLRVLAVLLLIPFHTARIFDPWEANYAKNAELSNALGMVFVALIAQWQMQLLFLLSGASTRLALRFRTPGQYLWERLLRLVIPFVFGLLVIVPPQVYYAARTAQGYVGSYLSFYPRFFKIVPEDLSGYMGTFTPAHLWFILFLFVFSVVALPLFMYLQRASGERVAARLASLFGRRGGIFLPVIPLIVAGELPDLGGKNPFYYLLLFVLGYLLMTNDRYQESVDRHKTLALVLAIPCMVAVLGLRSWNASLPDLSWGRLAYHILQVFNTWCWLIAMLGYAHKYLRSGGRFLAYASEGAYPFYILHQTVIITIGYYVVQWAMGPLPKFLLIAVTSFVGTTAIYDLVVRRTRLTCFLCGMKPARRQAGARPAAAPTR